MIIKALRDVGVATIIASGNDGFNDGISSPACVSFAVAVGSSSDPLNETASKFTNLSPDGSVKLLAPGENINAAQPPNKSVLNPLTTFGSTGTSFAAPLVAGAFAVLNQAKPAATVEGILPALICSGRVPTAPAIEAKIDFQIGVVPADGT